MSPAVEKTLSIMVVAVFALAGLWMVKHAVDILVEADG